MGCRFLLQEIFPTQGLNPGLLHCRQILYCLRHQGSPGVGVSEVAQSCPTLCDPMDCSLPGSSIRGSLQARVLEWVAVSFSRRSSQPRDRTRVSPLQADTLPSEPPGKPGFLNFVEMSENLTQLGIHSSRQKLSSD